MCGIIGYVGGKDALPILIAGLTSLTYRGYDSAGIAVVNHGDLTVVKTAGKVSDLTAKIGDRPIPGHTGLGHTRWATHGEPSDVNSHPHIDCAGQFAVIHNGIFENSAALRAQLIAEGHAIRSKTDTEVFAHLVEKYYAGSLEKAVRRALEDVEGAFALAVISRDEPGRIVCAKLDVPPMVIGLGANEMFISSDISSLIRFTKKVVIVEDGEMAVLTPTNVVIDNFRPKPVVGRRQQPRDRVFSVD
ncbi:MAG: hypothetical protein NZ518_08945 [Dehalococcoidia bacterium]|nr:hypothetical protein [Dehalococcoidia bacterium]